MHALCCPIWSQKIAQVDQAKILCERRTFYVIPTLAVFQNNDYIFITVPKKNKITSRTA